MGGGAEAQTAEKTAGCFAGPERALAAAVDGQRGAGFRIRLAGEGDQHSRGVFDGAAQAEPRGERDAPGGGARGRSLTGSFGARGPSNSPVIRPASSSAARLGSASTGRWNDLRRKALTLSRVE